MKLTTLLNNQDQELLSLKKINLLSIVYNPKVYQILKQFQTILIVNLFSQKSN